MRAAARFIPLLAICVPAALPAQAQGARRYFVPVLIMHHVKWNKPSDDAIERGLTISPRQFAAELAYLAQHHYHTVSAAHVVSVLLHGGSLPPHPVVLSFDDGYTDIYPNVYPLLRRYHMTATFFIVPGFLNTPRYLTWSQVKTMAAHGMDIEAHTMSHPDLTTLPDGQVRYQLQVSRQELETRLHRPVRVMAYPYGAYDGRIQAAVRAAGYEAAFTTQQGWWQSSAGLLQLPRVYVDNDDTLAIFAGRLVGDPAVLAEDPT